MRPLIAFLAAAASLSLTGAANAAGPASVEVKDAVARITVIPENRADVKVEITQANPRLPLQVRTLMGRTIVDGNLGRKLRGCRGVGDSAVVGVRRVGDVRWADMPRLVIRTPRDVNIDTGGAVWGTIGRSASLKLGAAGCGDWMIGNVVGAMTISLALSGDTRTGSAGAAKIRLAGPGDVATADVKGKVEIDVAGPGNVSVASVAGPLTVRSMGSGNVKIGAGQATTMTVTIAGSGNVDFRGVADSLKAHVAGSGDVHVHQVTGPVTKSILGSGGVTIGG